MSIIDNGDFISIIQSVAFTLEVRVPRLRRKDATLSTYTVGTVRNNARKVTYGNSPAEFPSGIRLYMIVLCLREKGRNHFDGSSRVHYASSISLWPTVRAAQYGASAKIEKKTAAVIKMLNPEIVLFSYFGVLCFGVYPHVLQNSWHNPKKPNTITIAWTFAPAKR